MNGQIRLTGMVLSSMPVGEYDRRIVLLTKERGKISAFARGARRPKSPLVAATNPFVSGVFEVYEGRDSYTVHAVSVQNYFEDLTKNLDLVWYGYYFLEVADYFSLENNDERERLVLLYQSFRALLSGKYSLGLIKSIFELKTLVINGDYPNVFFCRNCGSKEELNYLTQDIRGVVCDHCRSGDERLRYFSSEIYVMRYIIMTETAKVFHFHLKEETEEALSAFLVEYYEKYIKHSFKSEAFLKLAADVSEQKPSSP